MNHDQAAVAVARENLNVAKQQAHHVHDQETRYVIYSLIWSLEALMKLFQLRSVPTE